MAEWEQLESEISQAIANARDESELESVRVAVLGKKGKITALLKDIPNMSPEKRQMEGAELNKLRNKLTENIIKRRAAFKAAFMQDRLAEEYVDVTLPTRKGPLENGQIHPVSRVMEEVTAIFMDLGFEVVEGSDIETEFYNFTALNFPVGHPAREMHDTFFLQPDKAGERKLLRTHTSPVQIHTMKTRPPPLRIIAPGRTYRCDSDQTHTPMFHQLEGLVLDKSSHLGHMKWVLGEFCKVFFENKDIRIRFRPSFFPFTEPSMEVDICCTHSAQQIRCGEGNEWLEILGCGMVHPNVLRNCALDPQKYQGFAWGMGIDRLAMLKYGMPDLRAFFEADIHWLGHYGFHPLDVAGFTGRNQK
ncbi:MAG: phenylalanine--tRNA ligase subunit alpha [Alphaproteobacteria bacterium]|nr:phenylalanine--tRNA ligase subunit alpha [Alphaproteobacteria bacterium]